MERRQDKAEKTGSELLEEEWKVQPHVLQNPLNFTSHKEWSVSPSMASSPPCPSQLWHLSGLRAWSHSLHHLPAPPWLRSYTTMVLTSTAMLTIPISTSAPHYSSRSPHSLCSPGSLPNNKTELMTVAPKPLLQKLGDPLMTIDACSIRPASEVRN